MTDIASCFPITDPTLIFFVVMLIILFAPIVMGKLRIPHIIGMVLAGVAVGQYGLNILVRDDSFELFGKVGLYYIMFLASLEMDIEGVRRNKGRFGVFGLLTFAVPSIMTERAAQQITLRDKEMPEDTTANESEEKVLIPMRYPEYAQRLVNLAMMMRSPKNTTQMVGLNVVYDDDDMPRKQEQGQRLLERMTQYAAAADIHMQTQVRVAANIANGIRHAYKEFRATEILIGMHMHPEVSQKFWGEFHQSLFNGLNSQIIMARLTQPLATIRRIQVAVPSRAQFEPGFYRWLERLCRLGCNLECHTEFFGREDVLPLIENYVLSRHHDMRVSYTRMAHWAEMPSLAASISADNLFVVVTARKGTVSYKNALEFLPDEITRHFSGSNIMIIFPDQHGDAMDEMTFAQPQHTEEYSAYEAIGKWIKKKL